VVISISKGENYYLGYRNKTINEKSSTREKTNSDFHPPIADTKRFGWLVDHAIEIGCKYIKYFELNIVQKYYTTEVRI